MQSEILAVLQHCPSQPRILRGDSHHGAPVAASFDQAARPTAEAVLLVAESGQDGAGTHDQEAAQVTVSGLGDAPQPRLAAAAVLPGNEADPRGDLATVAEFVSTPEAGEQRTGGGGADAWQLHEALAARVLARCLGDGAVVVGDQCVQPIGVGEQVTDAAIGIAGQVFEVSANLAPQADNLLRQHDAEFADQAAQAVIERGALFNEALPRAVKREDDLLVFFLHRHEAHVGPGDGFADGGGVRRIVLATLAAHAVRGDEFGGDQFHRVPVRAEQPGPVVGARAGFHTYQAGRDLRNKRQQLRSRDLRSEQNGFAVIINAVYRKHILGEINSYRDNAHGLPLSWS